MFRSSAARAGPTDVGDCTDCLREGSCISPAALVHGLFAGHAACFVLDDLPASYPITMNADPALGLKPPLTARSTSFGAAFVRIPTTSDDVNSAESWRRLRLKRPSACMRLELTYVAVMRH